MSVDIKLKHSSVQGKVPTAGDLVAGEVAINTKDVKAYIKDADGNIVLLAGADDPRYVKLDDDGSEQTITGGGGLKLESSLVVDNSSSASSVWIKNGAGSGAADFAQLYFANSKDAYIGYADTSNHFMNFQVHGKEIARFQDYDSAGDLRISLGGSQISSTAMLHVQGSAEFDDLVTAKKGVTITDIGLNGESADSELYPHIGAEDRASGKQLVLSPRSADSTEAARLTLLPPQVGAGGGVQIQHSKTLGGNQQNILKINGTWTGDYQNSASPTAFNAACLTLLDVTGADTSADKPVAGFGSGFRVGASSNVVGFVAQRKNSSDTDTPASWTGFKSDINTGTATKAFNFYASGTAANYLSGNTYIGGTTARNTVELWKSTLTDEQLDEYAAGTLVAPANVGTPGDGSFARQWYYDRQNAETQAALDAGELEYPVPFAADTFTDTFDLGDNTKINLNSNGLGVFTGGVKVSGGSAAITEHGMWGSDVLSFGVKGSKILDILDDYRIQFEADPDSGQKVWIGQDPNRANSLTLTNGVHTDFSFDTGGHFNFYSNTGGRANYQHFWATATLDGDSDKTIAPLTERVSLAASGIMTYNMLANDASVANYDKVSGVNLNIGASTHNGAANPVAVKFGIGELNTQVSSDYIRIAGEFPDKDPSDTSYDQSVQNFVAIRGDCNTRVSVRGTGILVNDLLGPKNATKDIAELSGYRAMAIKPGDAEADHSIDIAAIHHFAVSNDTVGYLNTNFTTKAGANIVTGFSSNINESLNPLRKHYNIYASGNASSYFKGDVTSDGTIGFSGKFSLRMETDDPAAFKTTYSTDEGGNQVEQQTYVGTTEDLLSIIKDLRARVAALEAGGATTRKKR